MQVKSLSRFLRNLTLLTLLLTAFSASAVTKQSDPEFVEIIATQQMIGKLQKGGYVLYMRHGNTDNSRPDRTPKVDLNDCNTQRILNQKGILVTTEVGNNVRQANIPVGEVFASPMCRAKNSAQYAFGRFTLDKNLMYTGNMTSAEKKPVIANTRRLVSTPVTPENTNRILVAHAPNMMDLMGYFPVEATLVIFKPKGNNQFEYIGSIRPQDWNRLLKVD